MIDTTRRQLIGSVGSGLLIALAGCSSASTESPEATGGSSNNSGGDTDTEDGNSTVFTGFTFEGFTLNVSLGGADGYDKVVAFYDSQEFASTDVSPSVGEVTLDFSDYSPGEYRFVAISSEDDSVIAETTKTFSPEVEFEWKTASETDQYTPKNDISITHTVLTMKNTGTGPDQFNWVGYDTGVFEPAYTRPSNDNTTTILDRYSADVQQDAPPRQLGAEGGRELPVTLPPETQVAIVDRRGVIGKPVTIPYFSEERKDEGWAVQEGTEYDVTVTVGTKFSGELSKTQTVVWENIAEMDSLESQPSDALIATNNT